MDLGLNGKSVIVTAASKGLGKATALAFAKEGAHVLLASRTQKSIEASAEEIKRITGNNHVRGIVCDVKKVNDIKNLVQTAIEWNGTVDVCINNTGGPPAGDFEKFDDGDWQDAFESILLSVIRLVREVTPYMKKQQFGRIVTITSSSVKQSLDHLLLSNTFRPAIVGLSKTLAQEFAADNIFINTVGPGTIKTDRIIQLNEKRSAETGESVDDIFSNIANTIPAGRLGEPADFARPIVFLASEANSYVTGQTLLVDGGAVKAL
ncbi:SDR family oxidoreductase [Saliterribacillus persicus]|uniref:3-oxoacyl-[acyl-carrier protein] reductase n=1 Tax=Saliterribacillus persicus TaxID=930114 RepID=A0A368Y386_9BACI|nr:SDR family oxidoreductase [Saliterribacillus persicus]RCW74743.1 3-oxoacyl-[acyl-carrier protein] reductase [Saliterribacillus persicus]